MTKFKFPGLYVMELINQHNGKSEGYLAVESGIALLTSNQDIASVFTVNKTEEIPGLVNTGTRKLEHVFELLDTPDVDIEGVEFFYKQIMQGFWPGNYKASDYAIVPVCLETPFYEFRREDKLRKSKFYSLLNDTMAHEHKETI